MPPILAAIKAAGAAHVRSTELAQGLTSRWAVAWSYASEAAPATVLSRSFDVTLSAGVVIDRALQ